MQKKAVVGRSPGNPAKGTRITVTVPPIDYEVVRKMAKERKVSASWIVRDAVEKYVQGDFKSLV